MPLQPCLRSSRRGFTLVELLVVIVVLGILMAVAVPTFLRQQSKAQASRAQQNLATVYRELKAAAVENNNHYPSTSSLVSTIGPSEPQLSLLIGSPSAALNQNPNLIEIDPRRSSSALVYAYSPGPSNHAQELTAPVSGSPVLGQVAYQDFVIADGAAGYWRLGEQAGTTAVDEVGAMNGTYYGSPTLGQAGAIAGSGDTSAAFNGSSQYAEMPYAAAFNPAGSFTLEAWVYPTGGIGSTTSVVSSRDGAGGLTQGYSLYAYANGTWQCWAGKDTINWLMIGTASISLNTWTDLACVYNASTQTWSMYVNGRLNASASVTSFTANTARPFRIGAGRTESTASFFFPGRIDEVAVYPSALSAATLAAHYATAR